MGMVEGLLFLVIIGVGVAIISKFMNRNRK